MGIDPNPKFHFSRKEKSLSYGKNQISSNNSYNIINKSEALIQENKKEKKLSPLNMKINFIKKIYGKLQPFKQQERSSEIKNSNKKKFPSIILNSNVVPNFLTSIYTKNENKLQIFDKINRKNSELLLNENIKKV